MIPKIIHITWKDKSVLNSNSPLIEKGLSNLIKLNPEWTVNVYDDAEVNDYLSQSLDSHDFRMIENDHIVSKGDLWRLIKMYNEGGIYTDIDRYCNMRISDVVSDNVKCVIPTCYDMGFSQDFMMSEPGNPIFIETIKLFLERRKMTNHIYFLGAQTYNHAVGKCLTGEIYEISPGVDKMNYARKLMNDSGFIQTFREELPYKSILYRGNDEGDTWEFDKRKFYHDSGLRHWTNEW